MSIYTSKICSTCKTNKPLSEFNKNKSRPDGVNCYCKECMKIHRAAKKEYNTRYSSTYYAENKDKMSEQRRVYNQQYKQSNKERYAASEAKRRATKLQATPKWFDSESQAVVELYIECKRITDSTGIQHNVDHIVPLQSDFVCGLHCLANLQIIQASDNFKKNNHHWPDMP